jgi:hypothetical protein
VRRADGKILRFAIPDADEKSEWAYVSTPEAEELVAVGGTPLRIRRFALP